jgi:CheY-like chemotaxis protein
MNTKTILVVEDDDITRTGFGTVLRDRGYKVGLAANGQQALEYVQNYGQPDLIILDMLLPDVDGWNFLRRRDARTAAVPVLIVTALGVASNQWATSLGAAGWLRKPIDMNQLLEKVEAILGADGGSRAG